jgi:hypothetical protein
VSADMPPGGPLVPSIASHTVAGRKISGLPLRSGKGHQTATMLVHVVFVLMITTA